MQDLDKSTVDTDSSDQGGRQRTKDVQNVSSERCNVDYAHQLRIKKRNAYRNENMHKAKYLYMHDVFQ